MHNPPHSNVYRFNPRASQRSNGGSGDPSSSSVLPRTAGLYTNNNVHKAEEAIADSSSPSPLGGARRRHYSGSVRRPPSILNGLRDLVIRPRSESFGAASSLKKNLAEKNMKKVQVSGCTLESVYDLREAEEHEDFYHDELAFRRPRSNSSDFLILRKTSRPLSVDVLGLVDSTSDPYRQYMEVINCYELAPTAGSVVVVDNRLTVGKAFATLCENNIGAALVWDSTLNKVVSIVTLTDFLVYLQNDEATETAPLHTILSSNQLVTIPSDTKILDACGEFYANRVHRIVVTDKTSGDVFYLLTIKRILQSIHKQNRSLHFAQWLSMSIKKAAMGNWTHTVNTVRITDSLEIAVNLMLGFRISSLPVVNAEGKPVDVLCKTDLARALQGNKDAQAFFKSCSVGDALIVQAREPVHFASQNDKVSTILDMMLKFRRRRCVFVLDPCGSPVASVSLSDILRHLLYDDNPFTRSPSQQMDKLGVPPSPAPTSPSVFGNAPSVFGTPRSMSSSSPLVSPLIPPPSSPSLSVNGSPAPIVGLAK